MSRDLAPARPTGLALRIAQALGLHQRDKQPLLPHRDRMDALNDPQTRQLSPHLLHDVGVRDMHGTRDRRDPPEGEALRRYLW